MTLNRPPRKLSSSLEIKTVSVNKLYRISRRATGEPYFGKSAANRFDDPSTPKRRRFGTCYFGLDLETAIAETILHDEMPAGGNFYIAYSEIDSRYLLRFKGAFLNLANFTGVSLKTLVGDSSISTITPYTIPQLWAKAVYNHPQKVDGIYYMSRHLNDRPAIVVFERAKSKIASASARKLLKVSGIDKAITILHIYF